VRYGYPIMLDVTRRRIVIVGGGEVGARKARGLIDSGATDVRVIAPEFHGEMPDKVQRIAEPYRAEHLDGAGLVFVATDDRSVNEQVMNDARERGLLVNGADAFDRESSDFATPAVLRAGQVTIAVATGGNPALATMIRDTLARAIDPRWEQMAMAMHKLRPAVQASDLTIQQRRAVFRDLAKPDALNVLVESGYDALAKWLASRHPGLKGLE
jgi:precorrin-2 dehydrogenase / sirohydrochlorin ferrochelatase